MSEQGKPQFVVGYGGRLWRTQAIEELDSDDRNMLAMLDQAPEQGRAVILPDVAYKSMTPPQSGANIGDDQAPSQSISGANIGDDQTISGANIGDDQR
jgi:hypothetical protein